MADTTSSANKKNEACDSQNPKWVIPYIDQPLSFWNIIADYLGDHIQEIYFPAPGRLIPSGRPEMPEKHLQNFLGWDRLSKNVLLNPIYLPCPVSQLAESVIDQLHRLSEQYGIARATVTNVHLAGEIRARLPHFTLTASVLADIYTPHQIMTIMDIFDGIVASSRIMRNIPALQSLRRAFPGRIRLIVNEGCLPGCVERSQHFFEMANPKMGTPTYLLCEKLLEKHPWMRLTGAWVLPQHLYFYAGIVDEWKLAGRSRLQNPADYLFVLGSYIRKQPLYPNQIGGGPSSILEPIEISEPFFRQTLQCTHQCDICQVCRNYWADGFRYPISRFIQPGYPPSPNQTDTI